MMIVSLDLLNEAGSSIRQSMELFDIVDNLYLTDIHFPADFYVTKPSASAPVLAVSPEICLELWLLDTTVVRLYMVKLI